MKWFRIPDGLHADLEAFRMSGSDFVFGSYPKQLREFFERQHDNRSAMRVKDDFDPENLGEWMYRQIVKWSETLPNGSAWSVEKLVLTQCLGFNDEWTFCCAGS